MASLGLGGGVGGLVLAMDVGLTLLRGIATVAVPRFSVVAVSSVARRVIVVVVQ